MKNFLMSMIIFLSANSAQAAIERLDSFCYDVKVVITRLDDSKTEDISHFPICIILKDKIDYQNSQTQYQYEYFSLKSKVSLIEITTPYISFLTKADYVQISYKKSDDSFDDVYASLLSNFDYRLNQIISAHLKDHSFSLSTVLLNAMPFSLKLNGKSDFYQGSPPNQTMVDYLFLSNGLAFDDQNREYDISIFYGKTRFNFEQ